MFMPKQFLLCSLMSSLISLNIAASCAQVYLLESASHLTKLQNGVLCIFNHLNDHRVHNVKYSESPEREQALRNAESSFFWSKFAEHNIDLDIHNAIQENVHNVDNQTFLSLPCQANLLEIQCYKRDSKLKSSEEALSKAKIALQETVNCIKQDPKAYHAACTIFKLCRDHHDYQRLRYSALETQRQQLIDYPSAALAYKKQS